MVVFDSGFSEDYNEIITGAVVISRLDWKKICLHYWLLASLRRSFSKLTYTGFFTGLPLERQLASLKASESRQSENTQDRSRSFYNLISKAKIQEAWLIVGHLKHCLPQKAKLIFGGWEKKFMLSLLASCSWDRSRIVWRSLRILYFQIWSIV